MGIFEKFEKSEEKVLTQEIAAQFLADENSVNPSRFEAIEDAAAESLSKHEGYLDLGGLTSISDARRKASVSIGGDFLGTE